MPIATAFYESGMFVRLKQVGIYHDQRLMKAFPVSLIRSMSSRRIEMLVVYSYKVPLRRRGYKFRTRSTDAPVTGTIFLGYPL
jgi:hypothetical protein